MGGYRLYVIVAVIFGGVMWWGYRQMIESVRGLRNRNPGNIERTGTQWQGMAEDQSGDSRFVVFTHEKYGIRAMARILNTYRSRGVDTLEAIIATWAPPHENNTEAYILHVAERAGIPRNRVVTPADYPALIAAMIHHENGVQPYADSTIRAGIALA